MSEVTDEEMALDQKQLEAILESTKKSTTWSTKILNRFLFNKNMSVDLLWWWPELYESSMPM